MPAIALDELADENEQCPPRLPEKLNRSRNFTGNATNRDLAAILLYSRSVGLIRNSYTLKNMATTRDEILENHRRLRAEYERLFDSLAALLYRHDPIGINFGEDEYELEARTILPRLRSCHSADDVLQVVYAEFVRWFDSAIAGPQEHYKEIASEVWQLWQGRLANRPKSI